MNLLWRAIVLAPLLIIASNAQAKSSLAYCAQSNWLPYEGIRDGRHIGMIADYMSIISSLTGITFSAVEVESWQQGLDYLNSGRCEMAMVFEMAAVDRSDISLSQPFLQISYVLVTPVSTQLLSGYDAIGERITGIVEGNAHGQYIARYYPAISTEPVASEQIGLTKLAEGELDVMVVSLMGFNNYLRKHNDGELTISGIADPISNLRFALKSSERNALLKRINGAISTIPDRKRVKILQKWNKSVSYTQDDFWKYAVLTLAGMMVAGALLWRQRGRRQWQSTLIKRRREIDALQSVLLEKNRTIEFLSNHDSESGLYNRNYMIQKAEEEVARFRRFQSPATLVVLDVLALQNESSQPKRVKESTLMRLLGRVCLTTVRDVDVAARWSVDQLVLLCPQTSQADGHLLAKRLVARLEESAKMQGFRITLAAGVAGLLDNWSFNDWYEQASSMLYQARRQGGGIATLPQY
ncbi:transporter substrate-binding domain-containing diguanylate cyclase [Salinimonas chungwhensis]|uniref:transporter substrate-binding domain-containing diguanylate cyclase n=1 Tax=Salinimonas chungwhensis TaxID=265425 RepID=UPI00036A7CB1|nr:GGDEF domain-containing protein [Salinimonas chungwhensis]